MYNRRTRFRKKNISRPQAIRLSVSLGIFLAIALIRLIDPAGAKQLGGTVDTYIGDQTPSTIQAIGAAITGGGSIVEVFKNLSAVLTGSISEDAAHDEPGTRQNENPFTAPANETPPPANGEESGDAEDSVPYIYTVWEDVEYDDTIPIAYEDELVSGGGFGIDDTLPLPFGYDAPPNVDFTRHGFDFEHIPVLDGTITSRFGYRSHPVQNEQMFHYGIDIAANSGTEIVSFADGTVASTGKSVTYGNYVLINHADGVATFYAHCDKILVKHGAKVKVGQVIALVGNTGMSTGPHLHFEVRHNGRLLEPVYYTNNGFYE
ncbi:MAG: M23 family metallopeptidase [Oscillospiraceae bacterium]|nr:M23 family metallopeptidase [Oscillospiraceae bacterium]